MTTGKTMVEKIMARISGGAPVSAGDEVRIRPDFVMAYDFPGYTDVIFRTVEEKFGLTELPAPERFRHLHRPHGPGHRPQGRGVPRPDPRLVREVRHRLHRTRGHRSPGRWGNGYGVPGAFAVHYDGHISQLGALGTLAVNMPRQTLVEAFVRQYIDFQVAQTVRLNLVGQVRPGVMARDLFHGIVQKLGNKFARFAVLGTGRGGDRPAFPGRAAGADQHLHVHWRAVGGDQSRSGDAGPCLAAGTDRPGPGVQ